MRLVPPAFARAQGVWVNPVSLELHSSRQAGDLYFSSRLEAATFCCLQRFAANKDFKVVSHYPILLCSSKDLGNLYLKLDFKLVGRSSAIYFEAKGALTKEFALKLRMLASVQPEVYRSLFFVVNRRLPLTEKSMTINRRQLPLLTLSELDDFLSKLTQ